MSNPIFADLKVTKIHGDALLAITRLQAELTTLRSEVERLKKAETALDDQLAIQQNEPTTKTDSYMAGLLNGMLLAKANFGHEYNPISCEDAVKAENKLGVNDK